MRWTGGRSALVLPVNCQETACRDHGDMEKRRLLIGCEFTYVADIPTPVVFQVQPARAYTDLYGNPCVRAILPGGRSRRLACQRPGRALGCRSAQVYGALQARQSAHRPLQPGRRHPRGSPARRRPVAAPLTAVALPLPYAGGTGGA